MLISILLVSHALYLSTQGQNVKALPKILVVAEGEPFNITCEGTSTKSTERIRLKQLYPNMGSKNIFTSPLTSDSEFERETYLVTQLGRLSFIVTVKNATLNDAERYRCTLVFTDEVYEETTAVIIKRPFLPTNETLREGGINWFMCKVEFKYPDDVPITDDNLPDISVTIGGERQEGIMRRAKFDRQMEWRRELTAADDQKDLVCSACTKTPSYCLSTTRRLSVQYSVRNLTITPMKGVYHVGEVLTCAAGGNPTPSIHWVRPDTQEKRDLPQLVISQKMSGRKHQRWECVASNTVTERGYREVNTSITFTVTAAKPLRAGCVRPEGVLFLPALFAILMYNYVWE